jgi:ribonuclease P protein component
VYKLRERNDHEVPLQMLISVPKKHFHHAVDRNRVKRQVREAWRRHKSLLVEAVASDKQLLVAFVWLSDSMLSTQDVEERVAGIVKRLQERL